MNSEYRKPGRVPFSPGLGSAGNLRAIGCLLGAFLLGGTFSGCGGPVAGAGPSVELLNVSYDPTRELWRDLNGQFIEDYRAQHAASKCRLSSRTPGRRARPGR